MDKFADLLNRIEFLDPLHGKKVRADLSEFDQDFIDKANDFIGRFEDYLSLQGKTLEYGIDCYYKMIADVRSETKHYVRTGEYTSKSFDEVNKRVYSNPGVMEYYMNGLLLSQFLWAHHYKVLRYFTSNLQLYGASVKHYLEMGGGHGLYISEAIRLLGDKVQYDLIDISPTSIAASKSLINNQSVNYILSNIFDVEEHAKYDFATMGEVMEHVEDPVALLKQVGRLLVNNGRMFITTPTNAPAIDHIYLFKNADEIRTVIHNAGFKILDELCVYSEKVTKERAERFKIAMMYAAFIEKV